MPVLEHDEVGPQDALACRGHVLDLDHGVAVGVELHLRRRAAEELDAPWRAAGNQFS